MEYVIWIYKVLEDGQIKQLMDNKLDLAVKVDGKSPAPKQPLSGKTADLVLTGAYLSLVKPSMEYKRVRRTSFLQEPILPELSSGYRGDLPRLRRENEFEEIGISTLHIKGRLYYTNHDSYDTQKLFQWAIEEADGKGSGFRTVVFASLQDQKNQDSAHTNFRKIILPKAFVKYYRESYDDKDGMGSFEAVLQQSMAELRDWNKTLGETAN